jgi:hypothetical protein
MFPALPPKETNKGAGKNERRVLYLTKYSIFNFLGLKEGN